MRRILCVDDPAMFLWASALAFVLEFSFALLLLRGFYRFREGLLVRLGNPAQRTRPATLPLVDSRAFPQLAPEDTESTAQLRCNPAHDGYDDADRRGEDDQLRAE